MSAYKRHPASFKDPSGFVFESDGKLFRQVNKQYAPHYEKLLSSGLLNELVEQKWLISHIEKDHPIAEPSSWYKTLQPQQLSAISYPYEWCFEQVKDAALLTLHIARHAIDKGMVLKDATPYNVQFIGAKAVFIDVLSFEVYKENEPWVAYHQFCTQFLFPLYVCAYSGTPIHKLYRAWPQGITASLCWNLLPASAGFSAGVWMNVFLQKSITTSHSSGTAQPFSKNKMSRLLDHLLSEVNRLGPKHAKTAWSQYYSESVLSGNYVEAKERALIECIAGMQFGVVLDAGCNDGRFSHLLASRSEFVIAADDDERSISNLYLKQASAKDGKILPLIIDVADPSASQGFANTERRDFFSRCKPDLVVALALIHHLVITRNIPLSYLAEWLASLAPRLVIEWVPKEDEKVTVILAHRADVFQDYNEVTFEEEFKRFFIISKKVEIGSSKRVLYLMEKR